MNSAKQAVGVPSNLEVEAEIDALFSRHGGMRGRKYVELLGALQNRGITAFRTKFSPYYLMSLKLNVNTVVDVGVNSGTDALYDAFPGKKFVLVEPLEELLAACVRRFPSLNADAHCVAAGAEEGRAELNRMPVSGHNSLLNRDPSLNYREIERIEVRVRRLDGLLIESRYVPPFGLKVDTEGYELEVLRGAERIMKDVSFVIAEVSVKRIFEQGYRFSDAVSLMAKYGFELFDVLNASGSPPNHFDCLFLPRTDRRFRPGLSSALEREGA